MFVEGKGLTPPPPIAARVSEHECLIFMRENKKKMGKYRNSRDKWTRGGREDAFFIGDIGEYAVVRYIQKKLGRQSIQDWDYSLRPGGDGGKDIPVVGGFAISVKTGSINRKTLLIDRVRNGLQKNIHTCDAIFWCTCEQEQQVNDAPLLGTTVSYNRGWIVYMHGWITPAAATRFPLVDSQRFPGLKNLEVHPKHLSPMSDMIKTISNKKGVA